ncbi:invasion associated locus B family protein [Pacificibacter marinus]|uniref:Invasion associated locus B (IalB) protein n=1 Tax=Pacificibacter marinus TaxID=658057 RepID=A0A1Y5TNL7_9RHOB|nr:invasion associated locus B family protein [Pacificibacter marinus]SEL26147.1 Invasion protein IalB, involved in pathogenesis [Pacificibacter marinus]SLN64498.1 Invasion associated locus B (IalB) protein [Pacificibacter marinus]
MNFTSQLAKTATRTFCISAAVSLGLTFAAAAQDAQKSDAPAEDAATLGLSTGTPADNVGQPYLFETHGDWQINCIKMPEGQSDPCTMYQLLKDEDGNAVSEISLFHFGRGDVDAGATVTTPLETLLTEQLTVTIDGANGRRYPFSFCTTQGCQARLGFTNDDVALLKKGSKAEVIMVPIGAPDVKVALDMSLSGFTAGYTRVTELNLATRAAAEAAAKAASTEAEKPAAAE